MFDNVKLIASAAAFALLSGLIGWLFVSRANLQADLAQVKADRQVCLTTNESLKGFVVVQNEAVAKLQQEAKAKEEAFKEAQKRAEAAFSSASGRSAAILSKKRTGGDCEATAGLLNDWFGGRR